MMSTTAQTSRPATTYEQRDRIAIIRLDGGRRGTPLNRETLEGLRSGVTRAIADSGVDGAVITGTGTDFCFGADFLELRPLLFRYSPWWLARRAAAAWFGTPHPSEGAIREAVDFGVSVFRTISSSPKPMVMAVQGNAVGGGAELAAAGHDRIGTPDARFRLPEVVRWGMVPAWLGCVRVPQILYRFPDKAVDLIRTGRAVHAEEALAIGFFGAIVTPEALLDAAVRRAEELAADREIWPEYLEIDRLPTARRFAPRRTRLPSLADRLVIEFFREYGGRPLEEAVAAETEMMMACVRSGSQLLRLVAGIFG